ncbi:MAG: Spy/CpxP family protein refolding chaperone [Alcaligenaceae bacterium]|nr:Spy/CpxP family protein refolding chaperone [Alcaligenaceae bacterium]
MNTKTFLKASIISLGLTLGSTAAMAQAGPGAGQGMQQGADGVQRGMKQGPRADMRKQGRMMQDCQMTYGQRGFQGFAMMVPGYGPVPQDVVDSLNLSDAQKDKIAKIKASVQDKMQQRWDSRPFTAMVELRNKQLADGKLNPEEIIKEREKLRDSMQDRRGEFTDEWIEVWNDLNDEQQAKLAEYFKDTDTNTRGARGTGPRNR